MTDRTYCPVNGCRAHLDGRMMCAKHWRLLPRGDQEELAVMACRGRGGRRAISFKARLQKAVRDVEALGGGDRGDQAGA